MDIQTVQTFCCDDPEKTKIATPYSWGEYTYATNGHAMIRVLRLAEVPERADAPSIELNESHAVGKVFLSEPADWVPVPAVSVAPRTCGCCEGTGQAAQCPECDGEGLVELKTSFHHYDGADCKSCRGDGYVTKSGYESMREFAQWLDEEPKMVPCGVCFAGKIWPNTGEEISGVKINVRFLALIAALPGAQIGVFGPSNVARFRFDGGDGLVMPMR